MAKPDLKAKAAGLKTALGKQLEKAPKDAPTADDGRKKSLVQVRTTRKQLRRVSRRAARAAKIAAAAAAAAAPAESAE